MMSAFFHFKNILNRLFLYIYIYIWISYTNKYNKKLQSAGALNLKETPGHKQKENVKKNDNNKQIKKNLRAKWKWIYSNKKRHLDTEKELKRWKR